VDRIAVLVPGLDDEIAFLMTMVGVDEHRPASVRVTMNGAGTTEDGGDAITLVVVAAAW
jgi:hypothetical protein